MKDPDLFYLETIFTRSADGLLICDGQGRILKMNQAAERLNGIRADEVLGKMSGPGQRRQINRSATQEVLEPGARSAWSRPPRGPDIRCW